MKPHICLTTNRISVFPAIIKFQPLGRELRPQFDLLYIVWGAVIMLTNNYIEAQAVACMYSLYGSLSVYFGVKDFITILQMFRNKSISQYNNENKIKC